MPREVEIFARIVRAAVRLHTTPCFCTTGEYASWKPGKCFSCDGNRTVRTPCRIFRSGPEGTEADENATMACPLCHGSGDCNHCHGKLENAPDEYSTVVTGTVLAAWVQTMALTRGQGNFSRLSVQWDVMEAWVFRGVREAGPPDAEQVDRMAHAMFDDDPPPAAPAVTLSAGGLTEDDLRELGVLEDGETQGEA
jgi:hypothetical protein